MPDVEPFRAVYETAGAYDRRLLPHYYHGVEDIGLVAELMTRHYGAPAGDLSIVEFGCGTGRITTQLAPYASRLVAADDSPTMIHAIRERFPAAETAVETLCADTRDAVAHLIDQGQADQFDVVAAFWSLNYPLGEFFETMTADGVTPVEDLTRAQEQAARFMRDLVSLVAPDGHLLVLFFDADTAEQRLVTRLWERVAPFPEEGRAYTFNLLIRGLRAAENAGRGTLTHTRYGGVAWAPDRDKALAWFTSVHLKSLPALVADPEVRREVASFVDLRVRRSGDVVLPSGVHVIDFHAADLDHHLPDEIQ